MKQTYFFAAAEFLRGNIALTTAGRVKAYLIDAGFYTVSLSSHKYLSSVAAGARVAGPVTLTVTVSDAGIVDVADFTFTPVTGATVEAILYVFEAATPADATTILLWYESASEGLPTGVLTASTVAVVVDGGADKFGRLGDAA